MRPLNGPAAPLAITRIDVGRGFSCNCYLVEVPDGFVLVDTGISRGRRVLEERLASAGCTPGNLRLIVITHAHTDHVGSAEYLHEKFGAPIAMSAADSGKAESGDMFFGVRLSLGIRVLKSLMSLVGMLAFTPFTPDVLLAEGDRLDEWGLPATVLSLPGHTAGSIGLLADSGQLLCGDTFSHMRRPERNSIAENASVLKADAERLRAFEITTVYPGHGAPFEWSELRWE